MTKTPQPEGAKKITAGNIVIKGKKTKPLTVEHSEPQILKNINKGKPISQFMRDMMKTGV